jgi:hypothetical protein
LRLYNIQREDIYKLGDSSLWQPPLHLTIKERQVVETQGTVLLLGRSGTGYVCNITPDLLITVSFSPSLSLSFAVSVF